MKNLKNIIILSAVLLFNLACGDKSNEQVTEQADPRGPVVKPLKKEEKAKNEAPKEPIKVEVKEVQDEPIRILSLDGGGIRGIMAASILASIEKETGKSIVDLFDIFAGTSTGGIIALGLNVAKPGEKKPLLSAAQIEDFYATKGPQIFPKPSPFNKSGVFGPQYQAQGLVDLIEELVGNDSFAKLLKPVLITAFDIERKMGFVLNSSDQRFKHLSYVDVLRSTSAAPTFFAPMLIKFRPERGGDDNHYMVDGGLYKNNPSVLAFKYVLGKYGIEYIKKHGIFILSIGTGEQLDQVHDGKELLTAGAITWAAVAIDAIIDASSSEDDDVNQFLRQQFKSFYKYVRIQPVLDNISHPKIIELQNVSPENISNLLEAADAAKKDKAYSEALKLVKQYKR
jgi:hypothetical protein